MARVTRGQISASAVPAGTGVALLARLLLGTGQLATRASISAISYGVSNLTLGTSLGSGTFTVASIFDSLQQSDARWREDSQSEPGSDGYWGYNWAAALPAALFPRTALAAPGVLTGIAAAELIQADVTFTPVTGEPFVVIFSWQKLPVYG